MSLASPDFVDLGGPQRSNRRTFATLKEVRDRLTGRGTRSDGFQGELLAQHAAVLQSAAVILPLPVILTGFGLSIFTDEWIAVGWTLATLAAYLLLIIIAKRYSAREAAGVDLRRWTRVFLSGHVIAGLAWTALAAFRCGDCDPIRFGVFQFSVLFLAVAITAMVTSTLRGAVPTIFFPLAALLVYDMGVGLPSTSIPAAVDVMLLVAVPLFAGVAETLRRSTLSRLRHQAEKDELITELQGARAASDEARHRAEEANHAKSRFLATMSHELRTPLNAILGFSEVMSNEILGPLGNDSYKGYVRDIHSSGEHLLGLINEILDLSRVEAGRYDLNEEAIDLVEIAKECLSFVRVKAETKSLELVAEFEPDLPAIWADERSMRQIAINLLSNAVKFTPRGGRIILRVGWTAGGGQYLAVHDNGSGIPQDEIQTVLSSFGQGSNALRSAEQGTGLGLPIVQALLHLHGGSFDLSSEIGEGTAAVAALPASRVLEVMEALDQV